MGLYNMVFKTSPQMPLVMALLERQPFDFGRFRDAWVEKDDSQPTGLRLVVYTRNGGNNREECMPDFTGDPLYLSDKDDEYDSTYAAVYFRVPDPVPQSLLDECPPEFNTRETLLAKVRSVALDPVDMRARWERAIESIRGSKT
jgi:hypothetical protein